MFVTVSRAPYPEIAAYHKRMGWTFKWVSSFGSDFNFDYHVSFTEEDEKRGKAFYNFADMRGALQAAARAMDDMVAGLRHELARLGR